MDKTETAVLLSGGLDSSVALHWAHRNHRVRVALSFDYASNHAERELECAAWQAASLGIEHRVIDIPHLRPFEIRPPLRRGRHPGRLL